MTKAELNQAIAYKTKVDLIEVSTITETLFIVIKQGILEGNKVTFKGFGTFLPKKRSAKKVQLIKENKTISLSEHYIPAFIPSAALKNMMD